MKLNLNKAFVGLDGQPLPPTEFTTMGVFLAQALAQSPTGDPLKFWDWALTLHAGKEIQIDDSDRKTLVNFIAESKTFTALSRAQLQRELTGLAP